MGRSVPDDVLRQMRISYERGVPLRDIAKQYGICRQTVSNKARQHRWSPPIARGFASYANQDLKEKRKRKADDATDRKLVDGQQGEWLTVRMLLQAAIDHGDVDRAMIARHYAETLSIIQTAERGLRSYRTTGRLKARPLHLPNHKGTVDPRIGSVEHGYVQPEAFNPISFSDLFERWKKDSPHLSPATVRQWKRAVKQLEAFLGYSDALRVSRDDVIRWKDELMARSLSRSSIGGGYIGGPRALYNFGVSNLLLPDNPFSKVRLSKAVVRRTRSKSFSDDEARLILSAALLEPISSSKPHISRLRRWGPWLAAYSGARIGEVCQLRKQDIGIRDGIPYMHITPRAGTVKTKQDRYVPLHPQLLELGFIDEVEALRPGYIFGPEGEDRAAADRAKNIGVWVRSLGISDPDVHPNHGWRHRFKTISRHAGIPTEYHNAITGHANDRSIANAYGEFPLSALHREIMKLPWTRLKQATELCFPKV